VTKNISSVGCGPINVLAEPSYAKCLTFPLYSHIKEMICFQSFPLCVSWSPQYRSPHSRFFSQILYKESCSFSIAFLDMSYVAFRVSSTGALPPSSLHRAPMTRERHSIYRALFYTSKVSGKRPPPTPTPRTIFPMVPVWREISLFQSFVLHVLHIPQ